MIVGGLRRRRDRAARRAAPGSALARHLLVPPPSRWTPTDEAPLLAVDLETTGLDPRRDVVLSVGFVPVDGDVIDLGGARQLVVRTDREVGQSAAVHGLTDDVVAAGVPLEAALEAVLDALTGRALLAHFATIEEGFLSRACELTFGAPLPVRTVDTLHLQRRLTSNAYDDPRAGRLRLGNARAAHGLPPHRPHEALADALACAELYLAQRVAFAERGTTTLGGLIS